MWQILSLGSLLLVGVLYGLLHIVLLLVRILDILRIYLLLVLRLVVDKLLFGVCIHIAHLTRKLFNYFNIRSFII